MLPILYFSPKVTQPPRSYSQYVDSTFRVKKRAGVTYSVACLLPFQHHYHHHFLLHRHPPYSPSTMLTVEELLVVLNLNEAWLRQVIGTDEAYINRLVIVGLPRAEAERHSFRRDLENVLELMRSQNISAKRAARIVGRAPDESSSEEEEPEAEPEEEEEDMEENVTLEE